MKELCDKLVGTVTKLYEEDIAKIIKTEQDHSWYQFTVESVQFETSDGKCITITVRSPKVDK